jgi:beta-lactamase regulating signal transducer with metallopeptidase domain
MSEQLAVMLRLLFVALFNHLWQSTLFAAAILALTFLLRRNGARVRHLLWLAASLKFLVPFALVAALGALIPWHPAPAEHSAAVPRVLSWAGDFTAPMSGNMVYPNPLAATPDHQGVTVWSWLMLAGVAVWALGVVFVAVRWLVRWLDIRRALRASVALPDTDFPAPVRVTDRQFEPGVVGIFRPVLLLPQGIEERLTPEQMRAVLAHERCHLRWRDNLTAALHMRVEALFWFFPPVWWIGARLIEERERDCDEQVVRDGHAPRSYAEGILAVCEHYITSRLPSVSGVSGADLRQRVESIVRNALVLKLDRPRKLALAAIACCAVALPIGAGMVSGNAWQMLFSSPYPAAMVGYMEAGNALTEHLILARVGHGSALTCPAPGQEFFNKRNALAATVAKLSADDGEKALLFAVAANSTRDVQRLLAGGAARSGDGFLRPDSLMNVAAEFADPPMLELLTGAGFSLDERGSGGIGNFGATPLMTAISRGRLDNADWFIRHGADVSAVDKYGNSALVNAMIACSDRSLVARLINAGAVPNGKARQIAEHLGVNFNAAPATAASAQTAAAVPPASTPGSTPYSLTDDEMKESRVTPSQAELDAQAWRLDAQAWRLDSSTRYVEARGDFDGDGREDRAILAVPSSGWMEDVLVKLSSRNPDKWQAVSRFYHDEPSSTPRSGIRTVEPGTYLTICSNDRLQCDESEQTRVKLKHAGIDWFLPGSAGTVGYWDEAAGKFLKGRISDKAGRTAMAVGTNLAAAAAPIVPNGVPIEQARRIAPLEEGNFLQVIPLDSGGQPLWAPPSFGNMPPPLTDEELEQQWPRPDQKDLDAEPLRSRSPTRYTELTADFDGDGKPDRAVLRVEAAGWKEGLFVQLSSAQPGKWQPLNSVGHNQQSRQLLMGVSLVPPGTYVTACGKGYRRFCADEPREVVLKHPGIDYFQFESANSYVFWDEDRGQLRRVWISD